MEAHSTWDQAKFDTILKRYLEVTSRDVVTAINTKAYFIARKAVWFTAKADPGKIKSDLGELVRVQRLTKRGNFVWRRELRLTEADEKEAPLAALIINKRRGKHKQSGLYGKEMARAIRDMLAARMRSVAFIKSCWLPAIRTLAPLADKRGVPPIDPTAKEIGVPKGSAEPARPTAGIIMATIINAAETKRDTKNAIGKYGMRGLAMAFEDEANSMLDYIMTHLKPAADQANREL
jgi:hypothetical protein